MSSLDDSFLYKQLQSGQIDYPVMSFYTSTSDKGSYLKFGGMDLNAFEGEYSRMGTINASTWSIDVVNATISDLDLKIKDFMVVNFDPMLPYIYMPSTLWY